MQRLSADRADRLSVSEKPDQGIGVVGLSHLRHCVTALAQVVLPVSFHVMPSMARQVLGAGQGTVQKLAGVLAFAHCQPPTLQNPQTDLRNNGSTIPFWDCGFQPIAWHPEP